MPEEHTSILGLLNGNGLSKIKNIIGNMTPAEQVATAAVGTTAVVYAGASLWWWLLLLLVPFFLLRLKHYVIAIIDSQNRLQFLDDRGKLDRTHVMKFTGILHNFVPRMTCAGMRGNMIRFLLERGFLEIDLTSPATLAGHFSRKSDAQAFKQALIDTINHSVTQKNKVVKTQILEIVEKRSIWSLITNAFAKRRTDRQLRKLVK